VNQTRKSSQIERGISPRGALAFFRASQARAFLRGRKYVSPEDVHALAGPVLAHRVQLTTEAKYGGISAEEVLARVAKEVRVPT
jgi:MoxR-like ATPase